MILEYYFDKFHVSELNFFFQVIWGKFHAQSKLRRANNSGFFAPHSLYLKVIYKNVRCKEYIH